MCYKSSCECNWPKCEKKREEAAIGTDMSPAKAKQQEETNMVKAAEAFLSVVQEGENADAASAAKAFMESLQLSAESLSVV